MDTAVGLVATYLRINGYFVHTEVPVLRLQDTPGTPYESETDIDILAVRFPHQQDTVIATKDGISRAVTWSGERDTVLSPAADAVDVLFGEVKEGKGRLNPHLLRPEVLQFGLIQTGCCRADQAPVLAERLSQRGKLETTMPGGHRCRVRLISFCGRPFEGRIPRGVTVVRLQWVLQFITTQLHRYWDILGHAQIKEPVLALLALFEKLGAQVRVPSAKGFPGAGMD